MSVLGQSLPRIDARGKVTGQTLYPGDIYLPDMLHMKVLFAGRPHARVLRVDTSAAEAYPGVVTVVASADVPNNIYGLVRPDQPVLCGPGSTTPGVDTVRFVGDKIALIVAETEKAAASARDLIRVEYEDLPALTNPRVSMQAPHNGMPLLFPGTTSNIVASQPIRRGDIDAGFAEADVIVEGEYTTPYQEHAYLQPEAGVAYLDENGVITVHIASQWMHSDRFQIAAVLGLPVERVRVIYPAVGGAFGGREDMSVQHLLPLAVMKLDRMGIRRPVKCIWSREESIVGHHKRHPMTIKTKWGARRDGKVVAVEAEVIADAGAYQSTSLEVLGIAAMMCTGPYEIPNIKVDSYSVYTNNITCGAFRGFGGPQAALAAEAQITKLADLLDIDPVEIRLRNALTDGALASVGTPLAEGISLKQLLDQCAEQAGWTRTPDGWQKPALNSSGHAAARRGIGVAVGFKNVGFNCGFQENCTTRIQLFGGAEIEKAVVYHAGVDVGQGAHTAIIQLTAEALNLRPDQIELVTADTDLTEDSGPSSASRLTYMAAGAIKGAAVEVLAKWDDEDRPAEATYTYLAAPTTPFDPVTGYGTPNITYAYVAEAAAVEVDTETGIVRVLNLTCITDAGKVVNGRMAEGQVEGAVVQGHGYAVMENLISENGYIRTPHLSTYLIPTVLDIPEHMDTVLVENPDPNGPFGIRGVGEAPLIPVAAAVCAAVADATGVWIDEIPLTPSRVLKALRRAEQTSQQTVAGIERVG